MKLTTKYFKLSNNIFELGLKPNEFVVLAYISRCSNNNAKAFPSYNTIADKCNIGLCTAKRIISSLIKKGLIIIEKTALLARELFTIIDTDKEKVDIVCLLSLSLYINLDNRKAYADMLKGTYKTISPTGVQKQFTVTNVDVCAETYSSILTNKELIKDSIYLVDIGGCDISGVRVNSGVPDINLMFTKEKGMNIFYTGLAKILTSKLLDTYTEKDAELLFDKYDSLPKEIQATIDEYAENYIKVNILEPLKEIGYKELLYRICVVGGGANALEKYLINIQNIVIIDECIFSNVLGAKIISTRRSNK